MPSATYRALLREVTKQYGTSPQRTQLREHFRQMFLTAGIGGRDPAEQAALQRDAEDILTYMRAESRLKEILERSKAPELSDQDRIDKSARRVGLMLPKIFQDGEEAVESRAAKAG